jgi:hypothetical protein
LWIDFGYMTLFLRETGRENRYPLFAGFAIQGADAQKRVLDLLKQTGIHIVIPTSANHKHQRPYDEEMYKWRRLVENMVKKLRYTQNTRKPEFLSIFISFVPYTYSNRRTRKRKPVPTFRVYGV